MKKRNRKQKPDLSTQQGVNEAMERIARAAHDTGASMDYTVYLLVRTAHIIAQHMSEEHNAPDVFAMALYAIQNGPPDGNVAVTRDVSLN